MATVTLNDDDVRDFDAALALMYVAVAGDPMSVDCAVHLHNVCSMTLGRLCDIRNRKDASGSAITMAEALRGASA